MDTALANVFSLKSVNTMFNIHLISVVSGSQFHEQKISLCKGGSGSNSEPIVA